MASSDSSSSSTAAARWNPYSDLTAPSIKALPVRGLTNPGQNLYALRQALTATIRVLDQINISADGVDHQSRIRLGSARFHAVAGLALIDNYVRRGYTLYDNVLAVPGLWEAVEAHVREVNAVRHVAGVAPATPVAASSVGLGQDLVSDVVYPTSVYTYLGYGLAALGAWFVWRTVR